VPVVQEDVEVFLKPTVKNTRYSLILCSFHLLR